MRSPARWLFAAGSAERLAAVRIGLFTLIALRAGRGTYLELAGQPPALFEPRSYMNLLDAMPPRPVVLGVQAVAVTAALLAAAGYRARVAMPLAWVAFAFLGGMDTSLGKVMHNDVLLLLCAAPVACAPAADAWALDARRRERRGPGAYGWPVQAAIVVVVGAYVFAGAHKLISAGLGWVTSDSMRWILYASSDAQPSPNGLALWIADRPLLAHGVAAATIALEIGALVVLWKARLRPWFVAASAALHLGIWLAMRLDYAAQVAATAVVLIDWPAALDARRRAPAAPEPVNGGA